MKRIVLGLAVLAVSSVAAAADTDTMKDPSKPGSMQHGSMQQQGSMQQGSMGQNVSLAGVVSSIDKSSKTLTVVAPLGESENVAKIGDAFLLDEKYQLVAIDGAFDPKATITRDGKMVRWSELKEGDIIRTSYDPNTNMWAGGSATSKDTVKKELKKDMKDLKKDVKKVDDMAK